MGGEDTRSSLQARQSTRHSRPSPFTPLLERSRACFTPILLASVKKMMEGHDASLTANGEVSVTVLRRPLTAELKHGCIAQRSIRDSTGTKHSARPARGWRACLRSTARSRRNGEMRTVDAATKRLCLPPARLRSTRMLQDAATSSASASCTYGRQLYVWTRKTLGQQTNRGPTPVQTACGAAQLPERTPRIAGFPSRGIPATDENKGQVVGATSQGNSRAQKLCPSLSSSLPRLRTARFARHHYVSW